MVVIGKMIGETAVKAVIMFLVMQGLKKLFTPKKEMPMAPVQPN